MKRRDGEYISSNAEVELEKLVAEKKLWRLGIALQFIKEDFEGKKRKNGQNAIDHMIAVVWALWAGGMKEDRHLALAALHDDIEDSKRRLASIENRLGKRLAANVDRMTRRKKERLKIGDEELDKITLFINRYYRQMKKDWSYRRYLTENRLRLLEMLPSEYKGVRRYYERIEESPICVVTKCYDKIDVMKNMAYTLPLRSQKLQIVEYEAFLALACKRIRKNHPEFKDILFAGRGKIEVEVDNVLKYIHLSEQLASSKRSIRRKNLRLAILKAKLAKRKKP